ncbi:hypothetical protein CEQ90_01475 [Lewinellaceae bacterium SD302]|nr:hypothetical protein CEQ90_01475 [Lewinellaceae bacterium SD302]
MQGLKLVAFDDDAWNQRALAWILIDLCKLFSNVGNYLQAQSNYGELLKLATYDDIIEGQQEHLAKIVDPFHEQVNALNQKSKNGHHDEAVNGFSSMLAANQLSPVHHETYGWAIYRLLKAKSGDYTSVQVRRWLKHYLDLKNDRPSMVHSQILNWTMKYAETDPELRTMDFLKIWDASNLSLEDVREGDIDGNPIPSLFTRLCRKLVADPHGVDVPYLLSTVDTQPGHWDETNEVRIIDELRQQVFWQILKAGNENRLGALWQLLDNYLAVYADYPASHWHSEVLQLAERFTKEQNAARFLPFFKRWKPEKLRDADWKEVTKQGDGGEFTIKPLAQKALKKASTVALAIVAAPGSLDWLVDLYTIAVEKLPFDDYLPRDRAKLLKHSGQPEAAQIAYRSLVLDLSDKYYVWKEFADLLGNNETEVQAGMLAKALRLEKNEDYLGEIHLLLATSLLQLNRSADAAHELKLYHKHRTAKGWNIESHYQELRKQVADVEIPDNHRPDYRLLINAADEYAYSSIPWTDMTVISRWKTDNGKEKLKLYASADLTVSVSSRRFQPLRKAKLGTVMEVKVHKGLSADGQRVVYRPLLIRTSNAECWSALPETYAIVDYINEKKKIVHAITQDNYQVFFPIKLLSGEVSAGQYLSGRLAVEHREENVEPEHPWGSETTTVRSYYNFFVPQLTTPEVAESAFSERLILVDSVNHKKHLFHFITETEVDGVVHFDRSDLRPVPGDHFLARGYEKANSRDNSVRFQLISTQPTEEKLTGKIKQLIDEVSVIHKNGKTFGFIDDVYVHGRVLSGAGIFDDCMASATAVKSKGKWSVISIESLESASPDQKA